MPDILSVTDALAANAAEIARLRAENAILRGRVAELEAVIWRLLIEAKRLLSDNAERRARIEQNAAIIADLLRSK
jgi:hypothetical protein